MSEATTSTADHYERMLAEAQAHLVTAPVVIPFAVDNLDALEVCNIEVGERFEAFELGPDASNRYLRVRGVDNVALAAVLRRLADDLEDFTFDERERQAELMKVECPGCRTRIAPDDVSCGAVRCDRIAAQEASL